MSWRQSCAEGGGFLSSIAIEPNGTGFVVSGGDVSGLHLSENLGSRWYGRCKSLTTTKLLHVACLKWSAITPGTVYAALGSQGSGGGITRSTDYGKTWLLRSSTPQFSGGNANNPSLPAPHPRSTGNLIELDEANGSMYVGTYSGGVMRSSDGGSTWTTLGLSGQFIRGMALDPANLTTLWVCVFNDSNPSVYTLTNIRGSATTTLLSNSPVCTTASASSAGAGVEELIVLNGTVYGAGANGIWSLATAAGDVAWTQLETTTWWGTLTGYLPASGPPVLYAGRYKAVQVGSSYSVLKKSSDGGSTWAELTTTPANISLVPYARTATWWLAIANPGGMLGGTNPTGTIVPTGKRYICSQIALDPSDRQRIMVAGRAGAWRSDDGGTTWAPIVQEHSLTIRHSIRIDPNNSNNIWWSDTDWVSMWSLDRLATCSQAFPGLGANIDIMDLHIDRLDSTVYAGCGDTSGKTSNGFFYSRTASTPWEPEPIGTSLADSFDRTTASGWGTASAGGAWTPNSAGSFSTIPTGSTGGASGVIAGPAGLLLLSVNTLRYATLPTTTFNAQGVCTVSFDAAPSGPAGAFAEARILAREASGGNAYYAFCLEWEPGVTDSNGNPTPINARIRCSFITPTITLSGATGGSFTLTLNGHTTTALAFNAAASTVQSALETTVGSTGGGVDLTVALSGSVYTITYTANPSGPLGFNGQTPPSLTANGSGLTGSSPTITVNNSGIAKLTIIAAATFLAGAYTAGSPINFTWSFSGSTLSCSAWFPGDDQPTSPLLQTTDTTLSSSGLNGLAAIRGGGATSNVTVGFGSYYVVQQAASPLGWTCGITTGRDASNNKVELIAVANSGMWRKVNGVWTNVITSSGGPMNGWPLLSGAIQGAPMSWPAVSTSVVYLLDPFTGIWRSTDYGVTWTEVWAVGTITFNTTFSGFMTASPVTSGLLWIVSDQGLYTLTGADTGTAVGTGITATLLSLANPGPIKATSNGNLYAATIPTAAGAISSVQVSSDQGATWTSLSNEMQPNSGPFVLGLDVDSTGRVYVTTSGSGLAYYIPHDTHNSTVS